MFFNGQDSHRTTTEQVLLGWWVILSTAVTLTWHSVVLVQVDQTQQSRWSNGPVGVLTIDEQSKKGAVTIGQ